MTRYAHTLHRLVFGVLRQMAPAYHHKYRYPPLHSTQLLSLQALRTALDADITIADLLPVFQEACFSLFAHHRHKHDTSRNLNQFFSPVICFLVLWSVKEKGGFKLSSVITQTIAHIMFSIRAVLYIEIKKKAEQDGTGYPEYVFLTNSFVFLFNFFFRAYSFFKEYLLSIHETPMAYYYNTLTLLSTIRSDETNEARFTCTDMEGREFSYEGNILKVNDITKMIHDLYDRYSDRMKSKCFGRPIPESLLLDFKIEDLVDNLQNNHPGYSFIEDPRNPFQEYRSSYGKWLLSDPKRAEEYTYINGDQIIWKPGPSFDLLGQMQEMREILLLLCIFTAGPSSRATEIARQLLRNAHGSLRNLLILFHVVCLVDIQDKTSHKHLKDRYVPHCPTRSVAHLLIYNLVIFRPFEEYLAQILLGDEASLRYHQQLWPAIHETISDTTVSDAIGRECGRHLVSPLAIGKISYKILFWRNFVTVILKYRSDLQTNATYQQYYVDTAMMHSSSMAIARYGGESNNLPMSDPRQVVECIKLGSAWQKILNISPKISLNDKLDEELEEIEANDSGMFFKSIY